MVTHGSRARVGPMQQRFRSAKRGELAFLLKAAQKLTHRLIFTTSERIFW